MLRGFLQAPVGGQSAQAHGRGRLVVTNVATPTKPPTSRLAKRRCACSAYEVAGVPVAAPSSQAAAEGPTAQPASIVCTRLCCHRAAVADWLLCCCLRLHAFRSKVELIKERSDFLRHPLMEELVNDKTFIGEESMQLMKFHGSYMQDHREKRAFGAGKAYMFMMRTRQPAGGVTNQLYLAMDELADKVPDCHSKGGTMLITS